MQVVKKKILMINPNWNAYSEVWLHRMMEQLEDMIVGVACFSPKARYWKQTIPTFDLFGVKSSLLHRFINKIPILKYFFRVDVDWQFLKFVKMTKPDIIFINFIGPALYLNKSLNKIDIPIFIHAHGIDTFINATYENGERVHPDDYILKIGIFIKKNVQFIANSHFTKRNMLELGIPSTKISVKYFGVHTNKIIKTFNYDELNVLFLGRFVDFKGPDLVIMSFIRACKKGFRGKLKMVGDGPLLSKCKLLVNRSKYSARISFMPPVDKTTAAHLFQEAHIHAMHSCLGYYSKQAEAFGVTIIESMSFGTPTITANYGGPAEIITNHHDGILIPSGDINSQADALLMLQNSPGKLEQLSKNALNTIKERFTLKGEKEKIMDIFEKHS